MTSRRPRALVCADVGIVFTVLCKKSLFYICLFVVCLFSWRYNPVVVLVFSQSCSGL